METMKVVLEGLAIIFGLWGLIDSFVSFHPIYKLIKKDVSGFYSFQFPKLVISFASIIILMLFF